MYTHTHIFVYVYIYLYVCTSAFVCGIHACGTYMCAYKYMYAERPERDVICPMEYFHLILEISFSLNWASNRSSCFYPTPTPPLIGLQALLCYGFELMSSCLFNGCSYPLSHLLALPFILRQVLLESRLAFGSFCSTDRSWTPLLQNPMSLGFQACAIGPRSESPLIVSACHFSCFLFFGPCRRAP